MRLIALVAALLLACVCPGAIGAQGTGPYTSADELLDAIERAEGQITRLSAQIRYDRVYGLVGDEQSRLGTLYYKDERGAGGDRAFSIRFTKLALDDAVRDEEKLYIFDGEWVTELLPESKQFFKRQVVPPGEDFDPLKIGEGPLPIPIGQAKADILKDYDVKLVEQSEGLIEESTRRLASFGSQIVLTPRKPGGEFEEIRLWYADRNGTPVPVMARTVNDQGDESTVILIGVELNDDATIPADVFDAEPPDGFDVQITPWRRPGDEQGRAPETAARHFAFAQPELIDEDATQPGLIDPDPERLLLDQTTSNESQVPPLAHSVRALLDAPYTTEDEAKDLRIFHGYWTPADLDTPARRARAALIRGDYADPVFDDPQTPALDRAEGLLERGAFGRAIEATGDDASLRARRLRAEASFYMGDWERTKAELAAVVAGLSREQISDASELVEGVRALNLRARVVGQDRADGSDFNTLLTLLARARNDLDRLAWPANLAEAQLLYERDNRQQAYEATQEVLRLNPACAKAWALLGRMAVDRLAFDEAQKIAQRLDLLASADAPSWSDDAVDAFAEIGVSPLGAVVTAHARIRQNDPASGIDTLERALGAVPGHVMLRAMLAASYATAYDLDAANAVLESFDKDATGHFWCGWALSERRQYAAAAVFLEEAVRREPLWPEPWIQLGLLETQSGRDARARDALETAFKLDPFNVRADNTLRLLRDLLTWETIETDHFVIRFEEGIDRVLAREMAPLIEGVYDRVTGTANNGMGHEPGFKTVLELTPDHQSFAVRIAGMPSLHTIAAATGPVIAMEAPRESPKHTIGPYDWLRVFQHEYTHTVTLDRTAFRIPLWFTEAAAQLMEDAPRDEQTCRLLTEALLSGGLFPFDQINVKFARPEGPSERQLAYAQGLWMYEHIIEAYGARKPIELMDAYAAGEREVEAFENVLGVSREAFRERFEAWALDQARSWGLALAEGVPSMPELAERDGVTGNPGPETVESWLREYPDHPQILELLASLVEGVPDDEEAALLRRYANAVPVAESPHRKLARYALASDDPSAAIEHLEFLDARAKYTPAYAAALAERYAEMGDFDRASVKATRATTIAPYDARQRDIAARVALASKDYDAALRHITALAQLEPDRPVHQRRLEALRKLAGTTVGDEL